MKRKLLAFIATSIIVFGSTLVPVGSFLLAPHTAHAQGVWDTSGVGTGGTPAPATPDAGTQTTVDPNQGNGTSTTTDTTNTSGSDQTVTTTDSGSQTDQATPPAPDQSGEFTCSITDILCGIVKFTNFILNSITNLVATIAAAILDFSIHYSISSGSYSNDTVNTFLVSGWKLVRDFSTIFLMFALFVVGFLLIFNAEGSDGSWAAHFSPGRTIARVLIVALLVNFSFIMCRGIIEIGNVFAIVLYDKVDQGNPSVQTYPSSGSVDTSTALGKPSEIFKNTTFSNVKSISVGILANINPQKVILGSNVVSENKRTGEFGDYYTGSFYIAYLFVSVIAAIINLLMIFIFASMAFLFLGRLIGLYIGIILSPFAFVSWTIPFLENMPYIGFDNWLKDLVGLTFLAPVYMLFVYLTVAFMKIPNPVAGSGVLAAAVFATIDALLCVFVLLKGKKIAENMAGQLGTVVSGFAGKLAVAGVGLATGGTGLLASSTLGAAGGILARSGTLKRLEDAGPSQKQEDVQQRMKTASTFRKFGMGRLATSIEKGNFSTSGMLSSAARNVRSIGKSTVTTNPLDAKIIGTSVRGLTGKIATAAEGGKKPLLGTDGKPVLGKDGKPIMVGGILEQSLDKDLAKQTQKGAIMNRALDIAATKNKQNTITNNQTNAVNAGLNSNPLGSQPGTGTPAGSTPQTSPTNPPTNPPTGGVTTPNKNIPPVGVTVPNAPNQITPQTSSNLTQVQRLPDRVIKPSPLKPENLVISAENITINQPAKSATVDRPPAPVTIVDRFNKPITREPIIAPTTPSGSHAKNYLSGIQSIIPPITNKMAPVIDTLKNINNDQQKITGVSDKQQV